MCSSAWPLRTVVPTNRCQYRFVPSLWESGQRPPRRLPLGQRGNARVKRLRDTAAVQHCVRRERLTAVSRKTLLDVFKLMPQACFHLLPRGLLNDVPRRVTMQQHEPAVEPMTAMQGHDASKSCGFSRCAGGEAPCASRSSTYQESSSTHARHRCRAEPHPSWQPSPP